MTRRHQFVGTAVAVVALLGTLLVVDPGGESASGAPATAPTVNAKVRIPPGAACSLPESVDDTCVREPFFVDASASPASGRSTTSVEFLVRRSGSATWTSFQTLPASSDDSYSVQFDPSDPTYFPSPGNYDFEVVATDDASPHGETGSFVIRQVTIAVGVPAVGLADPGDAVRGAITLTAAPEAGGTIPDTITFERSPAGADDWTEIGTAEPEMDENGFRTGFFKVQLDTATLNDGPYDFRVRAQDGNNDVFVSRPRFDRIVDNTPPNVALTGLGRSISGVVKLDAPVDDPTSGIASVSFQRAVSGSSSWVPFSTSTATPFSTDFDTRLLQNGRYDFRVTAVDNAGNRAFSATARGVEVANQASRDYSALSVDTQVAPANGISLLGEVAGSAQHETWAYGSTTAAPASVDGSPLPYTVPPGDSQIVLLRYGDDSGWRILDVLRNADGTPYQLFSGATRNLSGAMASSGEAWVVLTQKRTGQVNSDVAVFHRAPADRFLLDPVATSALQPMLRTSLGAKDAEMRVATGAGGVYGVLRVPNQPSRTTSVPLPTGGAVNINARLDYGVLSGGTWSTETANIPASVAARSGETFTISALEPSGAGTGWGTVARSAAGIARPLMLGAFDNAGWSYSSSKLDALDLTARFAPTSPALSFDASGLRADPGGVWIGGNVTPGKPGNKVVAHFNAANKAVSDSWCGPALPRPSLGCGSPLDASHPATVPDAVFQTPDGEVGLGLQQNAIAVYAHGGWKSVATPGFSPGLGRSLFSSPTDGWLVGPNAIARVTGAGSGGEKSSPLAPWPQANRSTLTSVAVKPGSDAGTNEAGALAVGLDGTAMRYDPGAGWQLTMTPTRARRLVLRSVAFQGPDSAFAVGQFGVILHWDGSSWSEDPQSISITQSQLNSVAFARNGEGWAVGSFGTILHYDGRTWSEESPPPDANDANLTSVTIAGSDVFAVASGNLIKRGDDGSWTTVPASDLPTPTPVSGSLRLVSGLPDGGLVLAGRSVVIIREGSGRPFRYADQPIQGIAVALAAFRDRGGSVRSFLSVAPPVPDQNGSDAQDVAGYPPGDGELLRETANGWQDLSQSQYPGGTAPTDGVVKSDPVLAVAPSLDGTGAWVVGGYAGTVSAARIGTYTVLPARSAGWRTAAIWRYDSGGSTPAPSLTQERVSIPAKAKTVSFAFFSGSMCRSQCAAVRDAQPDVNLRAAAREISEFAEEPGGPAFAVMGGNARGPLEDLDYNAGNGGLDFANLPDVLSPLGTVPLFAAYGPRDAVPTAADPAQPWADALAQSPAPFGQGDPAPGIDPAGAGASTGPVNRYYAFDSAQNGGRLRVIVLDNSRGSLESSAPGQTAWLDGRLADAQRHALPVVVVTARPLNRFAPGASSDGDEIARKLVDAGVLGVFTTSGSLYRTQVNRKAMIPAQSDPVLVPQIPEYEGATLGYQQSQNNGVLWYLASVDTRNQSLSVQGIPVLDSLALRPTRGLRVARSSTLSFEAVARRPQASIATTPNDDSFPGIDQYVGIPASNCSGCIGPSYRFRSADPTIGNFVVPSGPGSIFPKLDSNGQAIPSASSGLFCGFNSGTTTISVTSGLLTASLPVTVDPGDIGRPCGTVFRPGVQRVIIVPSTSQVTQTQAPGGTGTPPPPPATSPLGNVLPKITLSVPPLPLPEPHPLPKPKPNAEPIQQVEYEPAPVPPPAQVFTPVLAVPPVPPAAQPIPPGGAATSSAPSAARRREKARKQAKQSAFVTRPTDVPAQDWFYGAVGIAALAAVVLAAMGLKSDPRGRPRPAWAEIDSKEWRR